jgi:hypothetical protein
MCRRAVARSKELNSGGMDCHRKKIFFDSYGKLKTTLLFQI